MTTIKSYTDIEQSKKLAEILPIEGADMYYFLDPTPAGNIYHLTVKRVDVGIKNLPQYGEGDIPCWSLAALLSLLPDSIYDNTNEFSQLEFTKKSVAYIHGTTDAIKIGTLKDNFVDACVEMILKLKEKNLL